MAVISCFYNKVDRITEQEAEEFNFENNIFVHDDIKEDGVCATEINLFTNISINIEERKTEILVGS